MKERQWTAEQDEKKEKDKREREARQQARVDRTTEKRQDLILKLAAEKVPADEVRAYLDLFDEVPSASTNESAVV